MNGKFFHTGENPLDKIVVNLFERILLGNDFYNQVTLKSRIHYSKKQKNINKKHLNKQRISSWLQEKPKPNHFWVF